MDRGRLLLVAMAGEGALATLGLAWIRLRALPTTTGSWAEGAPIGLAAAAALAAVNLVLLRHAPDVWPVRSIREVYRDLFRPVFARVGIADILVISAAAGIGEELFFRGAVQMEWGLVAASALFGVLHVGGSQTVMFGVWAALIGAVLGWLARATGGLAAPIVAHAAYDALALAYIRWAPDGGAGAPV